MTIYNIVRTGNDMKTHDEKRYMSDRASLVTPVFTLRFSTCSADDLASTLCFNALFMSFKPFRVVSNMSDPTHWHISELALLCLKEELE